MPIYESIIDTAESAETGTTMNMTPETRDTRSSWVSFRTKAGLAMLGGACLVFFAGMHSGSTSQTQAPLSASLPLMGSSLGETARPCTFDECNGSNCNHDVAPYTCLFHNGGPHGGCSETPWTDASCTDQCDLTGCADLTIPDDAESCDDVDCEEEWCSNGRLCGPEVPYQCTDGASRFGCSADKFKWTFRSAATSCASCCNIKTC